MAEEKQQVVRIVLNKRKKINTLGRERGLSLKELAEKSSISAAGIQKIKSNEIIPTITTMMKIADALGRKVSYFIEEEGEKGDAVFISSRKRETIFTFKKGLSLQGISAKKYGDFIMTAAYALVQVGASSGKKPMNHRGEELIYCLQGQMEFQGRGKTYILNPVNI